MNSAFAPYCRDVSPLLGITVVYVAAGAGYEWITGQSIVTRIDWGTLWVALWFGGAAVAIVAGSMTIVYLLTRSLLWLGAGMNGSTGFAGTWADYRLYLQPAALAGLFAILLLYVPFMNVFVGFKQTISSIQPFGPWDLRFMRLDQWLHFGHHPWLLLQPLFGKPVVTGWLDTLYYIWFPIKIILLICAGWRITNPLNRRFLVSFLLLWIILGNLMATAFASAGPCYYGSVVEGPDPYGPLMAYLHSVDRTFELTALDIQSLLWNEYSSGRIHLVEGIAAMPSLHVAVPVLWALWGWKIEPRLGAMLAVYAAVVLVGSVHLGWHYAVDGYVTFLLVPLIWWAVGRALNKYDQLWARWWGPAD